MALPLLVLSVIVVGTALGTLILTTKMAVCPSVTVGLPIVTIGKPVLSIIVPIATTGAVLVVLPEVTVPVKVNVSVPSLMISPVVGILTVTVVAPAGIVTVVLDNAV